MAVRVLSGFAILSVSLALLGIFVTLSRSVILRRRELGIRIALGAGTASVLNDVLRRGLTIVGAGVAIGVAIALVVSSTLAALLHNVSRFDPLLLGAVATTVMATGLIATLIPAWNASRTDPLLR